MSDEQTVGTGAGDLADDFDFFLDGSMAIDEPKEAKEAKEPKAAAAEAKPSKAAKAPAAKPPAGNARGKKAALYFDLETVPDASRLELFDLPPLPEYVETPESDCPAIGPLLMASVDAILSALDPIFPPSSWLDQMEAHENGPHVKKSRKGVLDIIRAKRGAKQAVEDAKAERIKLLSTTPEFCSIASLAYSIGSAGEVRSIVAVPGATQVEDIDEHTKAAPETMILDQLWSLLAQYTPAIGYHVLGFDFPVVFARSAILRVAPTKLLDLRPWGNDVLDLYAVKYPKGSSGDRPAKLKQVAPLYGIEVPAGDVEGSQVHELMAAGKYEEVAAYNRSDVVITRALHLALRGYFWA